ncbi:MAG TPA: UDP-diphosphatase [Cyanobacteria bacterium UBA8530]|nr:UDP-diphosphatase [Cyanobacteria bacterium UBA8530]
MNVLQALVLGTVQGLTEFLPISSTAHLVLIPTLFRWPDPGLTFDVALHLGTFLAVAWYFWEDLIKMALGFFESFRKRDFSDPFQRLPWLILLGTIPAGIAGLLLEEKVETTFRSPLVIATTLIFLGLLLWAADWVGRRKRPLTDARWFDALLIGLAQAIALIPGVSRSGSTMTAALFMGLKREDAARFSFLLGFPIILLSALFKMKDLAALNFSRDGLPFLVGMTASTVSGYLCIRFFIRFLQKRGMGVFVVYRIALGLLIFGLFLSGNLPPALHL